MNTFIVFVLTIINVCVLKVVLKCKVKPYNYVVHTNDAITVLIHIKAGIYTQGLKYTHGSAAE